MFEPQPLVFAIREDEMVQIVKDEFQRFWVGLVNLYDLGYAACIKRLIFYVAKITKYFFNFILHV